VILDLSERKTQARGGNRLDSIKRLQQLQSAWQEAS